MFDFHVKFSSQKTHPPLNLGRFLFNVRVLSKLLRIFVLKVIGIYLPFYRQVMCHVNGGVIANLSTVLCHPCFFLEERMIHAVTTSFHPLPSFHPPPFPSPLPHEQKSFKVGRVSGEDTVAR